MAFNGDGSINLDAKYSNDGKDEPVFMMGTYKIEPVLDGYPDSTFEDSNETYLMSDNIIGIFLYL